MADDPKAEKKEKKKPEGLVIPPKKPKLTKAERRALQEQQRSAKAANKKQQGGGGKGQGGGKGEQPPQGQQEGKGQKQGASKGEISEGPESSGVAHAPTKPKEDSKTISLFSHLPPYQDPKSVVDTGPRLWPTSTASASSPGPYPLHPAVIALGHQYALGEIRGGNSRCRAMLRVFHQVLGDFQPPPDSTLTDKRQQVEQYILKPSFQYWTSSCRPHSVTMGNAFTFLKTAVGSLERDMSRDDMVAMLQDTIEAYIRERIDLAQQAIAQQPALQLKADSQPPQVFLTYGNSEAIAATFLRMAEVSDVSQFRVIVVDSRPLLEGKNLLLKLREANIDCSYILLSALTYVLRDVTKVYLGASALMSDGGLLGRVGTACVALSAHMHHIPVLACCESYKISNRVQLESITGNEMGDPSQVANLENSPLENWLETDNLRLLNLLYDLTPSEFVSGIVTELGIIPPTSVAVLLREMNAQIQA